MKKIILLMIGAIALGQIAKYFHITSIQSLKELITPVPSLN